MPRSSGLPTPWPKMCCSFTSATPTANRPTVIDVLNGGEHVAVHAVVPVSSIYQTIGDLRAIGATGVLVTRIERLVP